jgi:hypothetical protein
MGRLDDARDIVKSTGTRKLVVASTEIEAVAVPGNQRRREPLLCGPQRDYNFWHIRARSFHVSGGLRRLDLPLGLGIVQWKVALSSARPAAARSGRSVGQSAVHPRTAPCYRVQAGHAGAHRFEVDIGPAPAFLGRLLP